jgi:hypothetical protein
MTDLRQREPAAVQRACRFDLFGGEFLVSARHVISFKDVRHGVAVHAELVSQLVDRGSRLVSGHQPIKLSVPKPSLVLPDGSRSGFQRPRWDHFEELSKAFSLFTEVRVTSHDLHKALGRARRGTGWVVNRHRLASAGWSGERRGPEGDEPGAAAVEALLAGRATLDRAVRDRLAHWEDRPVPTKDGRLYIRRFVVAGPRPSIERPALMSARELVDALAQARITESELARRLGTTPSAVNYWKRRGEVPAARVAAVHAALG